MKKTILVLTLAVVALVGSPTSAHKATISFAINNQQSESLGTVTVSTLAGDAYVNVAAEANTSVDIASTATSVTINGQQVLQSVNASVTLPSSAVVFVYWTAPGIITILDHEILQLRGKKFGVSGLAPRDEQSSMERDHFNIHSK